MKKILVGFLSSVFAIVGLVGASHTAQAYSWCFIQTDAGVTSYPMNYIYDFGSQGTMRCGSNGWLTAPGSTPSAQVGSAAASSNTISWPVIPGANTYTLTVATDPDFMVPVFTQAVTSTTFTVPGLVPNVNYYYHVYGMTVTGAKTAYSPKWYFRAGAVGSTGTPIIATWVNSDGDRISPSQVNVDFTDGSGKAIFPEWSWNKFGPDK